MSNTDSFFTDSDFQEFSDESELAEVVRSIGDDLLRDFRPEIPYEQRSQEDMFAYYSLLNEFYSAIRLYEKGEQLADPLKWPIDPYYYQSAFMFGWSFYDLEKKAWDTILSSRLCFFPQWSELSGYEKDPFRHYYLDFANPWLKLAIEIDGKQHNQPKAKKKDIERDKRLRSLGYTVYRIPSSALHVKEIRRDQESRHYNEDPCVDDVYDGLLDEAYGEVDFETFSRFESELSAFFFSRFKGFMTCLRCHLTGDTVNSDVAKVLGYEDPRNLQNAVLKKFDSATQVIG